MQILLPGVWSVLQARTPVRLVAATAAPPPPLSLARKAMARAFRRAAVALRAHERRGASRGQNPGRAPPATSPPTTSRPHHLTTHQLPPPQKLIPASRAAPILPPPLPHESLRGAAGAATGSPWLKGMTHPGGTAAYRRPRPVRWGRVEQPTLKSGGAST